MKDIVLGFVGKPSAGKSTFFNAICYKGEAKIGAFPFTTIEPNQGLALYQTSCPCKKLKVKCSPNSGMCEGGKRMLPIQALDVAGLIPGASTGLGLGNKFLDDLRHADVLIHVIDVSGTTDHKGEETFDYDPSRDHEWLLKELEAWVFNNMFGKLPSVAKRAKFNKTPIAESIQSLTSGYGSREAMIADCVTEADLDKPLDSWDKDDLKKFVSVFIKRRFPFVLALNKADKGPAVDQNSMTISEKFCGSAIVLCAAAWELRLQELNRENVIRYSPGDSSFEICDEDSLSEALKTELEDIKDRMLFRHGSTGTQQAVQAAIQSLNLRPIYPVMDTKRFMTLGGGVLGDCILVPKTTTVKELAELVHFGCDGDTINGENLHGVRVGFLDEISVLKSNVVRLVRV